MINRDKYLNDIIKSKDNGFPKVITGIRRCGKSYLLNNIFKEYLMNKNEDLSYWCKDLFIQITEKRSCQYKIE